MRRIDASRPPRGQPVRPPGHHHGRELSGSPSPSHADDMTRVHETEASLSRGVWAHLQSATCSKHTHTQKLPNKKAAGHDCLQATRPAGVSKKKDVLVLTHTVQWTRAVCHRCDTGLCFWAFT